MAPLEPILDSSPGIGEKGHPVDGVTQGIGISVVLGAVFAVADLWLLRRLSRNFLGDHFLRAQQPKQQQKSGASRGTLGRWGALALCKTAGFGLALWFLVTKIRVEPISFAATVGAIFLIFVFREWRNQNARV